MFDDIRVVSFDADDTLWHNEQYFLDAQENFWHLMENFLPAHASGQELMKTELQNIDLYGYGIKAFILSMIEAAIKISDGRITSRGIETIIGYGKEMLDKPVELIDGVDDVLKSLNGHYRLVMTTKGDLLDQERKLEKSGLANYFHHIEIVSDKKESEYRKLIQHLDIAPEQFLMIGNSLRSDILPVLNVGGFGIHVPYHTTWEHEKIDHVIEHDRFVELGNIKDLPALLTPKI
ncbi:MAG: putative hydrolase of the HAD superfamily [Patiriisocius sp.]|jgi:putative hydrolase of the HAD superfamily